MADTKIIRKLPFSITERDAENIAVIEKIEGTISVNAIIRNALELYASMTADAPKIEKARKEYRKAQATK